MESTGEPDRKRRHFGAISPTAASAKKHPLAPLSEEKKLDTAVLKFQNAKLVQKLESQRAECIVLENKFSKLREKQLPYNSTIEVVKKSWKQLVDDVESCSTRMKNLVSRGKDERCHLTPTVGASSTVGEVFLSRLLEQGATDSCSVSTVPSELQEVLDTSSCKTHDILSAIVSIIDGIWCLKNGLCTTDVKALPEDCSSKIGTSDNLVMLLRSEVGDLHLKHKSLAKEIQIHRDVDAKNKSEVKRLREELEYTLADLVETNDELAAIKSERDGIKGAIFPVLQGNKHVASDKAREKQKDMQEMESMLRNLSAKASSRQMELQHAHDERIGMFKELSNLQKMLKNVKCITSSQAYVLLRDRLTKAKADVVEYQALSEKLQVEKDTLVWKEREGSAKNDVLDVFHRYLTTANTRIAELEIEIGRAIEGRKLIETKLEEASREIGRKKIITEFKALVSSFPEDMGSMQSQLSKYKEAALDVHSLYSNVKSLNSLLDRKAKEIETLRCRSDAQVAELQALRTTIRELEDTELELQLILEMYRRESANSSDVLEARNSECKAWAHVQSLSSSLDEHSLEVRVKSAIEVEAISRQGLAAAEAEIADLRQKLENSKREKSKLTDMLKSKQEETETYLSEIETIGQAYDDMQTQNQHLLQQITERDDYNIKLVLEGVRAGQMQDALLMDKQCLEKEIQQSKALRDFYEMKAARIEDQVKSFSDQVQKLNEDRVQRATTLDYTRRRLLDVRKSLQQLTESMEESQTKLDRNRSDLTELQIELEEERFERKRVEEEVDIARKKEFRLRLQFDGNSVVQKLKQELKEYKEILKCSICYDRPKEVVITKCYHLFCNSCVQKVIESRHRKCPVCSASFGANDVRPVYI